MSNSTFFDDVVSFKANFSVTGEIFAQPIKITKNGVYIPPKGYAYAKVTVAVEDGTVDTWDGTGVLISPIANFV